MYARVARSRIAPGTSDRLAVDLRREVMPRVTGGAGFLEGAWLADLEADEQVTLVLVGDRAAAIDLGTGPVEDWDVLSFAGKLGGAWCLVHRLDGDALASVLEAAVDRAAASSGNVGAVALVGSDGRVGEVYAFSEGRPAEGHGGRVLRVVAAA